MSLYINTSQHHKCKHQKKWYFLERSFSPSIYNKKYRRNMSIKVWENFWKWNYPEISVHVVQEVIGIFLLTVCYWHFCFFFWDGSVCDRSSDWHFWETFKANSTIVGKFLRVHVHVIQDVIDIFIICILRTETFPRWFCMWKKK